MADPTGANLTNQQVERIDHSDPIRNEFVLGKRIQSLRTDLDDQGRNLTGYDWKSSVRAVESALTVSLSSPGATIAGVTLAQGDRVALLCQAGSLGTPHVDNGIYKWNGATSAMTRAEDFDVDSEVTSQLAFWAEEGTGASQNWHCVTADPILVGTTAIKFERIDIGAITAGEGLTRTANEIDLDHTRKGTSISAADASGLKLLDDSGTVGLFVQDGGRVGIGNINPAQPLSVTGNIDTTADLSAQGKVILGAAGTNYSLRKGGSDDFISVEANGSDAMFVHNTGEVGIGSSSEKRELLNIVSADAGIEGALINNTSSATNARAGIRLYSESTENGGVYTTSGSFTPGGVNKADALHVNATNNASGGLVLATEAAAPVSVSTNGTERLEVTAAGFTSIKTGLALDVTTVASNGGSCDAGGINLIDASGGNVTAALSDGTQAGQICMVAALSVANDCKVAVSNLITGNTITFSAVTEGVTLVWSGSKWHCVANNGGVFS